VNEINFLSVEGFIRCYMIMKHFRNKIISLCEVMCRVTKSIARIIIRVLKAGI